MLGKKNSGWQDVKVFSIYFAVVFFIMLRYPLAESLPSNLDSWFYMANYKHLQNAFIDLLQGVEGARFFYPSEYAIFKGEPSLGLFPLWLMFSWLTGDDFWTYFLMFVLIIVLNAFSVYKLLGTYNEKPVHYNSLSLLVLPLMYIFHVFFWANIDNINTLAFFPGIFSIFLYRKYVVPDVELKSNYIYLFFALLLFQLLCCSYNLIYTLVFLLVMLISNQKIHSQQLRNANIRVIGFAFLIFMLAIGYAYLILIFFRSDDEWNFSNKLEMINLVSFDWKDFIRSYKGTIYASSNELFWVEYYKSFFGGILFSFISIISILMVFKKDKALMCVFLIAFIIGLGAYINISGQKVILPVGWILDTFNLVGKYRYPYRIFMVIILIAIICIYRFLNSFELKQVNMNILVFVFFILFFIENFPFKVEFIDFKKIENLGYYLKDEAEKRGINTILFLPGRDFKHSDAGMAYYSKERIHMYWQTIIKRNVLNGDTGFIPPHLSDLDTVLASEDWREKLVEYCKKYQIDGIVYWEEIEEAIGSEMNVDDAKELCQKLNIELIVI